MANDSIMKGEAPPLMRRNKLSLLRLFYAKKSSAAPLFLLLPKKPKAFRGPLVHPLGAFSFGETMRGDEP